MSKTRPDIHTNLNRRQALLALGAAAVLGPRLSGAGAHGGGGVELRRLIANENPYGPGPAAREAAAQAVKLGWRYAMAETRALTDALAEANGVSPAHIMIGAGSAEILRVAGLRYARDGGEVIAARPTFSFLPSYARQLGCGVREISLDAAMRHDLPALAAAAGPDSRLLYFCNPNNPTGTLIEGDDARSFVQEVSARVPVLVDEAYIDLSEETMKHSMLPRVLAGDRVIIARTFSKLHGMAGLRVGYAIAPPDIIKELEALRVTMPNLVGVMAAKASLGDDEFLAFSRARIREAMATTTAVLDELGRPYAPSHGNFVLFDTGGSPRAFMGAMRQAGILTGLSFKPYDSWSRISMGRVEDMQVLAGAMRNYFQSPA